MNEPVDELYLVWLYSQVGSLRFKNPARTYWMLLHQMYIKPYVWLIPNDDNRVSDGKYLREEFAAVNDLAFEIDQNWFDLECSVLEMLIGLSRRLSFEAEGEPRDWFWHMLENLGITTENSDKNFNHEMMERIDAILDRLIWRTYRYSGHGGLFPLKHPDRDQRKVEIWYQLNAYLLERD